MGIKTISAGRSVIGGPEYVADQGWGEASRGEVSKVILSVLARVATVAEVCEDLDR